MSTKINADTNGLTETVDTSGILELQTAGGTAVIIGTDQNANFATTGAITVPVGSTAQRPTPVNGMMRYNSNTSVFEVYANNSWAAANVSPAPTNTVAPVISGSAIVGQNLTCTTGTWSGSPTSYFYQWNANSSPISGQTANVITLTLVENGANITCAVTAQNIAGNSSPATSNSLGPVIQGTTAIYLIVAGGGGGGGQYYSGGGGAGGVQTGSTILQPANTYSVTIGAGGAGGVGVGSASFNGSNTTFDAVSNASVGGGGGAGGWTTPTAAGNGGSGGGGGGYSATGGSGTSGQGYAGGNGTGSGGSGGGGGGAGQVGFAASGGLNGGNGGNGISSSISGVATYYGGGGGGGPANAGGPDGTPGSGGLGGGGGGGTGNSGSGVPGYPGSANTGGGGGGDMASSAGGGRGGSGIVIISYAGAQAFGGGVVSTDGSNTIHTFYTSGSLVPLTSLNSSYLIVAGGGGGGTGVGGGGGAGGVLSGSSLIIDSSSTYPIIVGSGGSVNISSYAVGGSGSNSSFSMVSTTAIGGGGGGSGAVIGGAGVNGGSGGGGGDGEAASSTAGGTGVSGQGYAGGTGTNNGSNSYTGGGGGGASAAGAAGTSTTGLGGAGGNGVSSSISGTATYYGGGGGGFGYLSGTSGVGGAGGLGGGGTGASNLNLGTNATANTGGGGGGGGGGGAAGAVYGGTGGSGVVIISYPGSTPMMAGGNVTVVSNTVVHTFTSSGYLTPFVNFNNSLRFRKSASATLTRTPTVTSNRKTWTLSMWFKRGILGGSATNNLITAWSGSGSSPDTIDLYQDNIRFFFNGSSGSYLVTSQVLRDPAAWYHIVAAVDTTQSTASNRMKLYINGSQVTAFSTATYPSQNYDTFFNSPSYINIFGNSGFSSDYFDGYMSNIYFVDGQQLTPNAFGTFNQYGVWAPVAYAGSYGTNGYYLPFNPGPINYAGTFNGSTQYLTVADNAALQPGSGAWTVEFWANVNPTVGSGDYEYYTKGAGIQVYINSGTHKWKVALSSTNTTSYFLSTDFGTPIANQWQHVALTYDGTYYRAFLDGVMGFETSSATLATTGSSNVGIGAYSTSPSGYGNISNVRFVKGTAVYTAPFTPPRSPLTAISGTGLLTLQNATIVDNSTNGFTITNNGSVAMSQAYPFSAGQVASDFSPQGNNWTQNNISGVTGSNLDYMVDVPTLTSANVANYAVWNPLTTGGFTFSNGNITASVTASTGDRNCPTTMFASTGKWYAEVTCTNVGAAQNMELGVVTSTSPYTPSIGGSGINGYAYQPNGTKGNNNTYSSYGATYTNGDVIGIALDMDAGTLVFYKNGASQGTAYTGITGAYGFAIGATFGGTTRTVQGELNCGQQPFVYTPPSGFARLNTYNL